MLGSNGLSVVKLVVNMVSLVFRGVVFGLLCKGVGLGLNMIVETDLNYRMEIEEGADE